MSNSFFDRFPDEDRPALFFPSTDAVKHPFLEEKHTFVMKKHTFVTDMLTFVMEEHCSARATLLCMLDERCSRCPGSFLILSLSKAASTSIIDQCMLLGNCSHEPHCRYQSKLD